MTALKPSVSRVLEPLLAVALFLAVNACSHLHQKPISFNSGQGWDGVTYCQIAGQMSRGQAPQGEAPYVFRIGTPFLASRIPADNLLDAFRSINLLASAVTVLFLDLLFQTYLSSWIVRVALLALFMTQWHAPLRFAYWYPANVDAAFFAFLTASLWLLAKLKAQFSTGKILVLSALMATGALFRESVLLAGLAALLLSNPLSTDLLQGRGLRQTLAAFSPALLMPLAAGVAGLGLTHALATQTNVYTFTGAAHYWAYNKPLPGYLLAWFIAYGPLLALPLFNFRKAWNFLQREQHLLGLLLGCALLAWIGGSDTDRICYWAMPVIYLLAGRAVEDNPGLFRSAALVLTLAALQGISQRILWAVPDYPNAFGHSIPFLTPLGVKQPYLDLWSYHAHIPVQTVALLEYALCTALLMLWLHHRSRALPADAGAGNVAPADADSLPRREGRDHQP